MRSSLVFFALIVMLIVAVNCASTSTSAKNQTPLPAKTCENPVVCNCNVTVNRDSHVSDAIKNLETKLEKLIALGKVPRVILNEVLTTSAVHLVFTSNRYGIFFTAVPASSCKELYEKHK